MDERSKRQIGEQVEPGDRPKAPGRLELLQRFINTWNHELPAEWDRLGTPQRARAWLREKDLLAGSGKAGAVSVTDAARLRELREAMRSLVIANASGRHDPTSIETVRSAATAAPLIVAIDNDGQAALRAARLGVDGAVGVLVGILHEAQLSGDWARLKGCRQCGYAFYDLSKNRSAAWCSMSICGNRTKNRAYYRRRHTSPDS